jgi:hypothetical protein
MQRACDACGEQYEAKRADISKFCTANCRQAYANGRRADHVIARPAPKPVAIPVLEAATRAELVEAGRVDSALGAAVLILAARIDAGNDTGAGLASLTRQWRDTLAAATAHAADVASPLDRMRDELAARRQRSA